MVYREITPDEILEFWFPDGPEREAPGLVDLEDGVRVGAFDRNALRNGRASPNENLRTRPRDF